MIKIAHKGILVAFLFLSTMAFAQEGSPPIQEQQPTPPPAPPNVFFQSLQYCGMVGDVMRGVVLPAEQKPLFKGNGMQVELREQKQYFSEMAFFVNQDTGTWTLAALYPGDLVCIIATGVEFEPVSSSSYPTEGQMAENP